MELERPALFRIVRDILVDELERSRRTSFESTTATHWNETTPVREGGLDLDSLERFTIAARLNETFALYSSGVEDNLLRALTIGDTLDVISAGLSHADSVCFFSGGTTGAATLHRHAWDSLVDEARELARICAPTGRVIVTVPVHHIYGFLFGVVMPQCAGVPVVEARWSLLSGVASPVAGDVVVGVPFLWERIASRIPSWPSGVTVTSSTAPLHPETAERLVAAGVRVVEVYGSSETSGIGWRESGGDGWFTLFPWWQRMGAAIGRSPDSTNPTPIPDYVEWRDSRHLRPLGRRDPVVQVGGVNVNTEEVRAEIMRAVPKAADCVVRLASNGRLAAFIVLPNPSFHPDLAVLRGRLPAAAIPSSVTTGRALPRNAIGKIADWHDAVEE